MAAVPKNSTASQIDLVLTPNATGNNSKTSDAAPPPPKRLCTENHPPVVDPKPAKAEKSHPKYQFGNYDRYYGYRNPKAIKDARVEAFAGLPHLFVGADVLDIGCNTGILTAAVARELKVRSIIGIDIDKSLISRARQHMSVEMKAHSDSTDVASYPHNVLFKQANYILADAKLLELEQPQFDTILCMSVTKWLHLNCGDAGLTLAFRRMFRQLRPGGHLILEAQDWKSYKRRKRLTQTIFANFNAIQLKPNKFDEYLLGADVGFASSHVIKLPAHEAQGFRRPIKVFEKAK